MVDRVHKADKSMVAKPRDGNQTLARGLRVLVAIAESPTGLSVQQVTELLEVHRSIAYRLLLTLSDSGLVSRDRGGAYLPGARLASLSSAFLPALRDAAEPVMRTLADRLQSSLALFVEEADDAVAVTLVEPTTTRQHIAFRPGMRTPLVVGAAGYAILAAGAPAQGEPAAVAAARDAGYALSHSEIEVGAYGVAAWITIDGIAARVSLNLITHRREIAESAGPEVREAADAVALLVSQRVRSESPTF